MVNQFILDGFVKKTNASGTFAYITIQSEKYEKTPDGKYNTVYQDFEIGKSYPDEQKAAEACQRLVQGTYLVAFGRITNKPQTAANGNTYARYGFWADKLQVGNPKNPMAQTPTYNPQPVQQPQPSYQQAPPQPKAFQPQQRPAPQQSPDGLQGPESFDQFDFPF